MIPCPNPPVLDRTKFVKSVFGKMTRNNLRIQNMKEVPINVHFAGLVKISRAVEHVNRIWSKMCASQPPRIGGTRLGMSISNGGTPQKDITSRATIRPDTWALAIARRQRGAEALTSQ